MKLIGLRRWIYLGLAVVILPGLLAMGCGILLDAASQFGSSTPTDATFTGDYQGWSEFAHKTIPADMLRLYSQAPRQVHCPSLPPSVLAGIGMVETAHNTRTAVSSAGAQGPMQFMPATWAIYGLDGNQDGRADINDPADAVPSAAKYLCASGADHPATLRQAIFSYNHAWWYVCQGLPDCPPSIPPPGFNRGVLAWAKLYQASAPAAGLPTSNQPVVVKAIAAAKTRLGTPYVWGGTEPGGFDCSGLMMWSYLQAGLRLPRTSREQYAAGVKVSLAQLQPGDLVYWANNVAVPGSIHHVAMYLGNHTIIAAPQTGDVVKIQPLFDERHIIGATRPILGG